jgi:transposase-like protein
MPRGVPHSPELRAQVVAAVLAGTSIAQAAKQFGVSKSLVSQWSQSPEVRTVRTQPTRARDPETIADLLYDLVAEHIATLRAQLRATARPEWLEKQSAAELADLLGAEQSSLIRLLAGFRPADDHDPAGLPPPADAASAAAADGG